MLRQKLSEVFLQNMKWAFHQLSVCLKVQFTQTKGFFSDICLNKTFNRVRGFQRWWLVTLKLSDGFFWCGALFIISFDIDPVLNNY